MTEILGRRPPQVVKRVAICPSECEESSRLGVIETDQLTYTCECGTVVNTVLMNISDLKRRVEQREETAFLDAADNSHASYCKQMQLDPNEE